MWQQELTRDEERNKQQRQGRDQAFGVYVNSTSIENEITIVSFYGSAARQMNVPHPFISPNSWIRGMPEAGSSMSAGYRADEAAPQAFSYIQRQVEKKIQAYRDGKGNYRSLYPGELEFNSVGLAQTHYSRRAIQDSHAALVSSWLDMDNLLVGDRGPLHIKSLFHAKSGSLQDSLRIGIVQRYKNTYENFYPKFEGDFGTEYYFNLRNPSEKNPVTLYQKHAGVLLDEAGVAIKSTDTSLPLRYQEKFYAKDGSNSLIEIDQKGNYLFRTAQSATEGYKIDVISGHMSVNVNKDYTATINDDYKTTVNKNWQTLVTKDAKFESKNFAMQVEENMSFVAKNWSISAASASGVVTGSFSLAADGEFQLGGKSMTQLGDPGSITNILGSLVQLGGGGTPVAKVGSTAIGQGNLGAPVISTIIVGSSKVFAS